MKSVCNVPHSQNVLRVHPQILGNPWSVTRSLSTHLLPRPRADSSDAEVAAAAEQPVPRMPVVLDLGRGVALARHALWTLRRWPHGGPFEPWVTRLFVGFRFIRTSQIVVIGLLVSVM